ncbi:hypothetical protein SAMN05216238_11354 [Lentibacillus persicus]|uniref:Uncharacterized protein n=1 Tax=Lentibacillus persicus TaxID=640948 RepID=A0A1I1ZSN0_9BACI|nr:hypothetical protein [Lentibacillus persicus]SFE34709.1 hypothetical protein SAMN05216238_11354 [Lentibacillus persicus]
MKRYLTAIFIGISAVVLIIGLGVDLYWSGIAAWGITVICLIFAVYFTKYIPNDENDEKH